MKIRIINEFSLNTVNYGNHLQAYAINQYLARKYPKATVETLLLDKCEKRKYASLFWWIWLTTRRCLAKCKHSLFPIKHGKKLESRFQNFFLFAQEYININNTVKSWGQLKNSDSDIIVVGSDVVWFQWRGFIQRTKFLDFVSNPNTVKISYAASFGKNHIPPENVKLLKECLADFKAISVRERQSVRLLNQIGIQNVVHTCDPTLLLRKEDWENIEQKPALFKQNAENEKNGSFCFAYLLGNDEKQRQKIGQLCKQANLYLVTIPYISGYMDDESDCFGNILVEDCSPQEWLWLIHHAQYVVTDSFHGLVFSSIFSTNFIAVKRQDALNLNMRLMDYLDTLGESNKYVDLDKVIRFDDFSWDGEKIQQNLERFRKKSERFLSALIFD